MIDDLLVAAVGHTTNNPTEFLATLKGENGEWKPEAAGLIKNHLTQHLEKTVTEQKGRAVRERMLNAEKSIKPFAEKYGIQWGAILEENLESLLKAADEKAGKETVITKDVEITDDLIAKHPYFKTLVSKEIAHAIDKTEKEKQAILAEYTGFKTRLETEKVNAAVRQSVEEELVKIKADLSKDPARRKNQIDTFVTSLMATTPCKLDENGRPYPVDGNGDPLSENYLPVTFQELVAKRNPYEVHAYDPNKDGAGARTQAPGLGQPRIAPGQFTSNADFQAKLRAEKDPGKKALLTEAYVQQIEAASK
jgi:hypothetical protein